MATGTLALIIWVATLVGGSPLTVNRWLELHSVLCRYEPRQTEFVVERGPNTVGVLCKIKEKKT